MAAGDGLVSMTPTSIAHSGTSASINADGGVDFTAVTSLSLNGVFTSDYDNYLIVIATTVGTAQATLFRLRASGSDATGADYARQILRADGSATSGVRNTGETSVNIGAVYPSNLNGFQVHVYGPALTQPTAWRSVTVNSDTSAAIYDVVGTHSLSSAYDGFTWGITGGIVATGNIHVFGYEE